MSERKPLGNLPLLLCGARNQLTLASLPSLDPELSSLSLYESGITQFAREVKRGSNQPLLWTFIRAFPVAVLAPMAPCIVCCKRALHAARIVKSHRSLISPPGQRLH